MYVRVSVSPFFLLSICQKGVRVPVDATSGLCGSHEYKDASMIILQKHSLLLLLLCFHLLLKKCINTSRQYQRLSQLSKGQVHPEFSLMV